MFQVPIIWTCKMIIFLEHLFLSHSMVVFGETLTFKNLFEEEISIFIFHVIEGVGMFVAGVLEIKTMIQELFTYLLSF